MFRACALIQFLVTLASDVYNPEVENLKAVTIPEELKGVSARMVIDSSKCSVTCGVGTKVEERCLVEPSGDKKDCEEVTVKCVAAWLCGMFTYTLTIGQFFTIDCLSKNTDISNQDMLYYWRISRGILTTDDMLFRPLNIRTYAITFSSIQEKDAGTYRCDVQNVLDLKLVKRLFYGVKVVSPTIVNLNFDKFMSNKLQLEALAQQEELLANGNHTEEKVVIFGKRMYVIVGVGSGVGILGGVLIAIFLLCPPHRRIVIDEEDEEEQ
ncbi:transmembrane protein 81 [Pelodytes ibericus]